MDKRFCGPMDRTENLLEGSNFTLERAKAVCYADPSCKGFYHNQNTGYFVKCKSGYKKKNSSERSSSILYLKGTNTV